MTTRPGGMYKQRGSTKPIDAPETLVGRILDGRFQLDRVLSSGGMGIIFIATQLSVSRKIAIKILRPTLSDELDLMQRFSQEVEVVASLAHPNIVSMIDAGRDAGGLMYLAMEFVEGETFREALLATRLPLEDLLQVYIQTCEALIEAHAHKIIHRDLKFDNIMLQRRLDGRLHVKILDFGVAKLLSRDMNLTRGGQVPGTPGIIAPELVAQNAPSARSDLYSLGVLLFTTLTGQPPFHGQNDLELMRAHQFEELPKIEESVQHYVPEALNQLVYELLEKDPAKRPRDAMDVRSRLETIRDRLLAQFPDLPAYVPPIFEDNNDIYGSGAFRLAPQRQRKTPPSLSEGALEQSMELQTSSDERMLVVPTSVVTMLALLLLVLIVSIVYMIGQLVQRG